MGPGERKVSMPPSSAGAPRCGEAGSQQLLTGTGPGGPTESSRCGCHEGFPEEARSVKPQRLEGVSQAR